MAKFMCAKYYELRHMC